MKVFFLLFFPLSIWIYSHLDNKEGRESKGIAGDGAENGEGREGMNIGKVPTGWTERAAKHGG